MLSIHECKTILDKFNYDLKDDEVTQLRDFLMMLALYQITENKEYTDEESNTILPSEQ
jgi:hypothetical protein